MKGRRVRLLTVAGVGATADVVVAADIPVGALQPALAKLVGDWLRGRPALDAVTANGTVLRPGGTLHDQEVQGRRDPLPPCQPTARPLVTAIKEPPK